MSFGVFFDICRYRDNLCCVKDFFLIFIFYNTHSTTFRKIITTDLSRDNTIGRTVRPTFCRFENNNNLRTRVATSLCSGMSRARAALCIILGDMVKGTRGENVTTSTYDV